ncbi:L,D-transpeptidase family protein [Chitinophaga nivalis]|uniref:L,D-transpeptidase n=1 Tax=Chitinophaga nivalis TaxID=2991709 RepID=A0ABT3IVR8_9BACT|nr:L,D-transpeptidase [Chitinophaga nivalis]MCW3462234.1 L,D-transpeptidase [Chitinophaga nivalis]MCW3488074.1 L,D-transpeptidase [Chitinophaga nivalis]
MRRYRHYWYAALLLVLPLAGFVSNNDLYNVRLTTANIDPDKIFLLIDKSDYRLYLYEDATLRKIYKVVFGNRDQTDKVSEGDRRTPEGTFHILSKRVDKSWSRFMLLDYPNDISWQKFHERQSAGTLSANATIGGGIGIHGVEYDSGIRDNYVESRINWTLGCISMKNADVNELYEIIKVGTPVVIRR